MFKRLRQKRARVLSHGALMEQSHAYLHARMEEKDADQDIIFAQLRVKSWHEQWWQGHVNDLKKIADSGSRVEQIRNVRRVTVSYIERSCVARLFLSETLSNQDKEILAKHFHPDVVFDQVLQRNHQSYVFAEASYRCMRAIASKLEDARKNDWPVMYRDLYSQFIDLSTKEFLAREKDDEYALSVFVGMLKQLVEETKEKIFAGQNWHYDRERMEREQPPGKAERKAKESPKQKDATNQQLDRLVEYLHNRYERSRRGELYRMAGLSPPNPFSVIEIDAGIMLLALSQCLEGKEAALKTIKAALYRLFTKLGEDRPEPDVNLNLQLAILEMQEDQWLLQVSLLAAYHLYNINIKELSEDDKSAMVVESAYSMPDIWEVHATTKNIFGHDYNTKL